MGCYKEVIMGSNRVFSSDDILDYSVGEPLNLATCETYAKMLKYKYFGVEEGGNACFGSNDKAMIDEQEHS